MDLELIMVLFRYVDPLSFFFFLKGQEVDPFLLVGTFRVTVHVFKVLYFSIVGAYMGIDCSLVKNQDDMLRAERNKEFM